nr:hypothetical protein Iba_chr01cCG0010 [Ipomoea batatas]
MVVGSRQDVAGSPPQPSPSQPRKGRRELLLAVAPPPEIWVRVIRTVGSGSEAEKCRRRRRSNGVAVAARRNAAVAVRSRVAVAARRKRSSLSAAAKTSPQGPPQTVAVGSRQDVAGSPPQPSPSQPRKGRRELLLAVAPPPEIWVRVIRTVGSGSEAETETGVQSTTPNEEQPPLHSAMDIPNTNGTAAVGTGSLAHTQPPTHTPLAQTKPRYGTWMLVTRKNHQATEVANNRQSNSRKDSSIKAPQATNPRQPKKNQNGPRNQGKNSRHPRKENHNTTSQNNQFGILADLHDHADAPARNNSTVNDNSTSRPLPRARSKSPMHTRTPQSSVRSPQPTSTTDQPVNPQATRMESRGRGGRAGNNRGRGRGEGRGLPVADAASRSTGSCQQSTPLASVSKRLQQHIADQASRSRPPLTKQTSPFRRRRSKDRPAAAASRPRNRARRNNITAAE